MRPFIPILGILLGCALSFSSSASQQNPAAANPSAPYRALLDQYCVTCHNERAKTAGLMLDKMDLDHVADNAETWEKAIRKLRGGMMPPNGRPRPANENVYGFLSWLESSLDRAGMAKPNPGRATIHRLNRTEYGNAVRDLLGLETDVAELLPADDESNGFDNIADVLKLSPTLLEQYLSASRKISSLAVGDPATPVVTQRYAIAPDISQEDHIEGLPLGTRGGMLVRHNFPLDGQYDFRVFLLRNIVGYMKGLEWPHQLEITIDDERVFIAPVG